MTNSANIIEIFSSIQGEGPYIGYRQLFIRLALCNLNCTYCDTIFEPQEYCKIEDCPGSGSFKEIKNPLSIELLIHEINRITYFNHHSISLTGGEPLLNSDFLGKFLDEFQKKKEKQDLKIYLETNGTLPGELEKIIQDIDIISMDFKLESSYGKAFPEKEHKEFIRIAQANNKEIFAKAVITSRITGNEISEIIKFIKNLVKPIPLILQPVSSDDKNLVLKSQQLLEIQEAFLRQLKDIRIIPQMHKYLNLL